MLGWGLRSDDDDEDDEDEDGGGRGRGACLPHIATPPCLGLSATTPASVSVCVCSVWRVWPLSHRRRRQNGRKPATVVVAVAVVDVDVDV